MVKLNKIYTRTGDDGTTGLGSGARCSKYNIRVEAFGTVDEANSCVGMARLYTSSSYAQLGGAQSPSGATSAHTSLEALDTMLMRIQNDLFDLGADLCTPDTGKDLGYEPLRIIPAQVTRLEQEIDQLNSELTPLNSFVLPGGTPASAMLHLARTVCRRAERLTVELSHTDGEIVSPAALQYLNRLSDFLFVASRYVNLNRGGDVLWIPGKNR